MDTVALAGLPREFDALAVQAGLGKDVEARLEALVKRVRDAAGTDAGWKREMEKVRARLRVQKVTLETPDPALPGKLADPHIHRQRAFYADAIGRLTALIEGA